MSDRIDFETRLEARLQARAALASRPFDAGEMAHKAIAAGARQGGVGRLAWPSVRPSTAWLIIVLLLVIALLGAIAFAGALLRHAPPAGASNGSLAFDEQDGIPGGNSQIYLVRSGLPEQRLLDSVSYDAGLRAICPSFSPDGTRLVYSGTRFTYTDGVTPTLPAPRSDAPIPSQFDTNEEFVVITSVDRTGLPIGFADRFPVTAGNMEVCAKWAPNGQSVAFFPNPQQPQLWIAPLAGPQILVGASEGINLDGFAGQFDWSPDGTSIVAVGSDSASLWIIPVGAGKARLLPLAGYPTSDRPSAQEQPRWSPDGTRIAVAPVAFADTQGGTTAVGSSIEVYRADGTGSPTVVGSGTSPVWSPNGKRLAYVRSSEQEGFEHDDLLIVTPGAGDWRVIASEVSSAAGPHRIRGLIWSPDGKQLLYVADEGTSGRLVSVSADGDPAPVTLTQQPHDFGFTGSNDISWQPVFP